MSPRSSPSSESRAIGRLPAPARGSPTVVGLLLVSGAVAGLMGLYLWVRSGEISEHRYRDYAEARASEDGWLPGLPATARSIHEWHDLDTNRRRGSFLFDPEDRFLIETLLPGLPTEVFIDPDPSFPSSVPESPGVGELEDLGFQFFQIDDLWFAVDWTSGVAYFWSDGS